MQPHSTPDNNPTQLIRYVLQIENMADAEAISQVRAALMQLGLLVDRIEAGEAEVAVITTPNPGTEGIGQALATIGYPLRASAAQAS